MEDPTDSSDDESSAPRPWSVTVASLVTSSLGLLSASGAEGTIHFVRGPQPPVPVNFKMAVEHALWTFGHTHRQGVIAFEVARLVLAVFLFVASVRVLLRARNSGWMWRQALAGNVVATLAAAWWERAHVADRVDAFRAAMRVATATITSPDTSRSVEEMYRLSSTIAAWITGTLALFFVFALRFASSERARAATD